MNFVYLRGFIKNIQYSHSIGNTVFNKADLIVKRDNGQEDLIIVKFKQFSLQCNDNTEVELIGNIRSFSHQIEGKNKVEIYVFSYFDTLDESFECQNIAKLKGRICKKDTLRTTSKGKHYIHYILANNIIMEDGQKLNSYIPCVAWGKEAKDIANNYDVGDMIYIEGQLHSREYKKKKPDGNIELRIAHEFATITVSRL